MGERERGVCPFVDSVPNYEIREGVMFITNGDWAIAMSLRTFERGLAKSTRVVAEYYAKKADVVPIPRRRKE